MPKTDTKTNTKSKAKKAAEPTTPTPGAWPTDKPVFVKDLAEKYQLDGKKIRVIIRGLNYRAPATGIVGMGPRAKYEWAHDSKKLLKIENAISEFLAAEPELDD